MWTSTDSPVGTLRIVADGNAVTAIEFTDHRPVGASEHSSMTRAAAVSAVRDAGERTDADPLLREALRQLGAYFARDLKDFELPLAPVGTPFQQSVWTELRRVAYGETVSYGELAARMGMRPGGSRAVGLANGRNPIPIVIPCHRVVGAKGSLTGYAGGVERKQTLLDLERDVLF